MYYYLFALVICLLTSCGNDDSDDKRNDGSNNTTDVSVTGNVIDVGATYAQIEGYVNLNLITSSYTSQSIGVELSKKEDFSSYLHYYTNGLEGKKLCVFVKGIDGCFKYYYRTFVQINGLYYYGKKRSFTTRDFSSIIRVGDIYNITTSSADIDCILNTNTYNPQETFKAGVLYAENKKYLHPDSLSIDNMHYQRVFDINVPFNTMQTNQFKLNLKNLKPNTMYYYCSYTKAGTTYKLSEIQSFSTKLPDPSGNGTSLNPFNVAAAIKYVQDLGADVMSPNDVYIKGYIISIIEPFCTQYGTASFVISDLRDGGNEFTFWRGLYLDNRRYDNEKNRNISVGDEVVVCGKIWNSDGYTPETVSGLAYVVSFYHDYTR